MGLRHLTFILALGLGLAFPEAGAAAASPGAAVASAASTAERLDRLAPAPGAGVSVRPCMVRFGFVPGPVREIERAGRHLWAGGSQRVEDLEVAIWARRTFNSEADFLWFLINWANVETGGSFDPHHLNASRGGREVNVGILQINQRWATRHNTWGHDSNPRGWTAADALDPYTCVHWALYHLLGFYHPARGDLTRMLDAYWHGTFDPRSPYARGVLRGRTIGWGE